MTEKYEKLKQQLAAPGGLAVAFSGGVDSSLLLKAAKEVLGDKLLAVTVQSALISDSELSTAKKFCSELGIKQIIYYADIFTIDGLCENPRDRCYICKKNIFSNICRIAAEHGILQVADGSNIDDLTDYRPGMRAIRELGIISPLQAAGFNKSEIRQLSKQLGLDTWDKPALACLASRFPYGEEITAEKLKMVEYAERYLFDMGFKQLRVRIHGSLARVELLPEDIGAAINRRGEIFTKLKQLGFAYIALDMEGFRSGSMNEVLKTTAPEQ